MGTRIKTFDSTGIAPNGRVYAGDLNAFQDQYADLVNLTQTLGVGQIQIGESGLQLLRYGAGEARISGALRTDGILRGLGGLFAGTFTTAQRNAITSPPFGLIILNITSAQFEWNSGTPSVPAWSALSPIPATVGSRGISFPSSPTNGQIFVLVDSLTNPTYQWTCWYNANSTSPYKWEVIGGGPRSTKVDAEEAPASSAAWVNLTTDGPSIALPSGIGGDFYVFGKAFAANSSGGIQGANLGITVGNTTPSLFSSANHLVGGRDCQVVDGSLTDVAAGGVIKLRYLNNSTTSMTWGWRSLAVYPIRLG